MNIAILVTGEVGSALRARLASTGHHVVDGPRVPAEHDPLRDAEPSVLV